MTSMLFVDDEAHVLEALRRAMRSMRNVWDMRFAASGAQALDLLEKRPADVIISDMRMPGMSGRELLEEVKRLYPATVRFILSGHTEPSAVLQAATTAHQYLAKPCDALVLKEALTRVHTLKDLMIDPNIAAWAAGGEALPSLPAIYQRIVALVQVPGVPIRDVAKIIEEDLAMSAMLLKVANSAYFGAANFVRTTDRAVSFLGIDNVASLILANGVVTATHAAMSAELNIGALWNHSLQTAAIARSLAHHEAWPSARVEDAFLAGLLHDFGHVILATAPANMRSSPTIASHERVGAYLVGLWGFPATIVEAIAFHHQPSRAAGAGISLPGILHAANALSNELELDSEFADQPDVRGRWESWRACAGEGSAGSAR